MTYRKLAVLIVIALCAVVFSRPVYGDDPKPIRETVKIVKVGEQYVRTWKSRFKVDENTVVLDKGIQIPLLKLRVPFQAWVTYYDKGEREHVLTEIRVIKYLPILRD